MKFGFFGAAAIAAAMFFTGCTDPCKDVNCNNGTCLEGDCVCDAGYQGLACDVKHNAKFVGVYTFVETCDSTVPATYNLTVAASSASPSNINITNLYEEPATSVTGVIKADGVSFTIARQSIGASSYGTVETTQDATSDAEGQSINLKYKYIETSTGWVNGCSGTMTKQ